MWIEKRILEPMAAWLSHLAFLQILEYIGKLAIVVVAVNYLLTIEDRRDQQDYENYQRNQLRLHEAWQVINSAKNQVATGGRITALQFLYREKQDLVGLSADNAFLEDLDLYDGHRQALLDSANFEGADLSGAELHRASLWSAKFKGAYLGRDTDDKPEETDLSKARLELADLRNADLTAADLRKANLYDANLDMAVLDDALLQGSDLRETSFEEASLQGANLQNVILDGGFINLKNAVLQDADLRGTDLSNAILEGANLRDADLRGTNITQEQIESAATGDFDTKLPDALRAPSWWASEQAVPLKGGKRLDAGRHTSVLFWPTLSFTVDEGWTVAKGLPQTDNYLRIERKAVAMTFMTTEEVYNPQNPNEENISPIPDDNLVAWLKGHPHLNVTSEQKVRVGGIPGTQLDVQVTSAPENYPIECDGPCVRLFPTGDFYYLDYWYKFIVLNIEGEKVFVAIDPLASSRASDVLGTVAWSNYQLPTEEEIFSGVFEPGLTLTAGEGWMDFVQDSNLWQISQEYPTFSSLTFTKIDKIRDPQDPTDKDKAMAVPDDKLVAWLKGHPRLDVTSEQEVKVGGIPGTQLDVSVRSTPKDDPRVCEGDCLPLFQLNDGSPFWLYDGYRNRLIVLQVKGETVIVTIETPIGKSDAFLSEAQNALSSVRWRD